MTMLRLADTKSWSPPAWGKFLLSDVVFNFVVAVGQSLCYVKQGVWFFKLYLFGTQTAEEEAKEEILLPFSKPSKKIDV